MNKTEKYQLNQWELTDRIQMEDFNADNAKIDAALAEQAAVLAGKASHADVSAAPKLCKGCRCSAVRGCGLAHRHSGKRGAIPFFTCCVLTRWAADRSI